MQTYYALVQKEPDSAFGITFPDLPGCFSAADDEDQVFAAAQTALALYAKDEMELPQARSLAEFRAAAATEIENGAYVIAVPLITIRRKSRYNLMLPEDVVESVDKTAGVVGISRSEYVSEAILGRLKSQSGSVALVRTRTGELRPVNDATGKKVSSAAAKIMKSKTASKAEKAVAASAMSQTKNSKVSGKAVASSAAKILKSKTASKEAKSVAASALTQKVKKK